MQRNSGKNRVEFYLYCRRNVQGNPIWKNIGRPAENNVREAKTEALSIVSPLPQASLTR